MDFPLIKMIRVKTTGKKYSSVWTKMCCHSFQDWEEDTSEPRLAMELSHYFPQLCHPLMEDLSAGKPSFFYLHN